MDRAADILNIISMRKAAGEPFALATVVRTVIAPFRPAGPALRSCSAAPRDPHRFC